MAWSSATSSGRRGKHLVAQWFQVRNDPFTLRFQEGGQRYLLAKRLQVLVCREPGTVRRNLEQNAVRLSEIQTAKPEPVDWPAVREFHSLQSSDPLVVFLEGRGSKRDVM